MRQIIAAIVLVVALGGMAHAQSSLPACSGDYRVVWNNCQGTLFANGNKYVGTFVDDKRTGQGTLTWSNGDKYVGAFVDGKRTGQGTLTWSNGNKYVGTFVDGKRTGQGTLTWSNGDKYVGAFVDDKRTGQGTYTFANGNKYVGAFVDDKFSGQGTFTSANGTIQAGIWANDKYVGPTPRTASAPPPEITTRSTTSTARSSASGVPMEKDRGTYVVPVRINGAITLKFTIDSGAADVSIPADVVSTLIRTGTLTSNDFVGKKTYVLADGSEVPSETFLIKSLQVGDRVVNNVLGSVADVKGSLLLGQSFLEKFNSWSIDNRRHVLVLE